MFIWAQCYTVSVLQCEPRVLAPSRPFEHVAAPPRLQVDSLPYLKQILKGSMLVIVSLGELVVGVWRKLRSALRALEKVLTGKNGYGMHQRLSSGQVFLECVPVFICCPFHPEVNVSRDVCSCLLCGPKQSLKLQAMGLEIWAMCCRRTRRMNDSRYICNRLMSASVNVRALCIYIRVPVLSSSQLAAQPPSLQANGRGGDWCRQDVS